MAGQSMSFKNRIDDPVEGLMSQQNHENHQIDQNHQICHGICVTGEGRDVRILPRVRARQELHQRYLPRPLSSADLDGLRLGDIVAAARVEERADSRVTPPLRLVQGLHLPLPIQATGTEAGFLRDRHENPIAAKSHPEEREYDRLSPMTCRIERLVIGEGRVTLSVSGSINEHEVETLRASLEQERGRVAIDLKDVLLVDRDAIEVLAMAESNGVELRNCPAYVREWVTRETADKGTPEKRTKRKEGTQDA